MPAETSSLDTRVRQSRPRSRTRTRQTPIRQPVGLIRADPEPSANYKPRGGPIERRVRLTVRKDVKAHCFRTQRCHDVTPMTAHRIRLAVDYFPHPTTGRLIVCHTCRDEPISKPVDVVWHESRRNRRTQRVSRVASPIFIDRMQTEGNDVESSAIGTGRQAIVTRQFGAGEDMEMKCLRTPLQNRRNCSADANWESLRPAAMVNGPVCSLENLPLAKASRQPEQSDLHRLPAHTGLSVRCARRGQLY